MFGYVTINQQEMKFKDYDLYRSYYCGICHALKKRYGRTGQMLLNYDMTFLAILLTGLYEPEEKEEDARCIPHPVRKHRQRSSCMIEYAADMTVLLAYEKAMDDWRDEHSLAKRLLAAALAGSYRKAAALWPRQARSLRKNVRALARAEKAGDCDIDRVSGFTGSFLAEIFVREDDPWQKELRQAGFYLGKFIYLLDAWEDRERDRKSGSYNLFLKREQAGMAVSEEEMHEILTDMIGQCALAFERLPVLYCADILRNIIYTGVWTKYNSTEAGNKPCPCGSPGRPGRNGVR